MKNVGNGGIDAFESLGVSSSNLQKRSAKSDKLGQEEFLELMLAQLRNQNPLKPMENGEFLGQMAQFGTVSGIQDLQASFNQLADALQSNQALQASALVGRSVLTPGGRGVLEQGGEVAGVVDLPASTTALTINVKDNTGQLVRRLEMGPQAAGTVQFKWDGMTDDGQAAPPGVYQVSADAVLDGTVTAVETRVAAKVESVSIGRGGQGVVLNVAGLGAVPLSEITQIM